MTGDVYGAMEDPGSVYEQLNPDGAGDGLLAGLRDGAWLDGQDFPPLAYAVPGLLPEGFSLLVGAPKIGKSWLVLNLALAAGAGGVALGGIPVESRPVLYLALEDGERRLQDRCRVLLAGDPIPAGLHYLTRVRDGRAIDTIGAWLDVHGAGLVILDTLGKVMPPALLGESGYQRDYRIGGALKALADAHPGTALLVNHHDRKAHAEDFVDSVSGTHGLAGAADTVLVLQRPRTETGGLLQVTGRDVPEAEYAVTLEAGAAWSIDGADLAASQRQAAQRRATAGLGDRSAEIVAYLAQHPDGASTAEVGDALDLPDARRYLARLAESGRAERVARGRYRLALPLSQVSQRPIPAPSQWDNGTHGTATTEAQASHSEADRAWIPRIVDGQAEPDGAS